MSLPALRPYGRKCAPRNRGRLNTASPGRRTRDAEDQRRGMGVSGQQEGGRHRHLHTPRITAATLCTSAFGTGAFRCTRSTRTRTRSKAIAAITTWPRSPMASMRWSSPLGPRPLKPRCTNVPELGIQHVWMHRGPGTGSVSQAAADYGRQQGIAVIDGGCPCMFGPTADFGHKAMRVVFSLSGNIPREV